MSSRAYLSLGSNLGNRNDLLGRARAALIAHDHIQLVSCSEVRETKAVDVVDQPDFLNQVVGVETTMKAGDLLRTCMDVERGLGRDRAKGTPRGPRTIDLDILLYEGLEIRSSGLTIPHPRLAERPFFVEMARSAGAPAHWIPVVVGAG
jgi:2-amino-4-hydroxy-6-hydroxymethyldihydropteridine diphosphokinase